MLLNPTTWNNSNDATVAQDCDVATNKPTVSDVASWLQLFLNEGQVTQLLALDVRRPGLDLLQTFRGYYDHDNLDQMAVDALKLSGSCRGVYFTFNPLNPALLARCSNRFEACRRGQSATDDDVVERRWFMVDVDADRPGGISSTDEEKSLAWQVTQDVQVFLAEFGFPEPVIADSGNGYHLFYRVNLAVNDELPGRLLKALNAKFEDAPATIDTKVSNPARITRLYGMLACKGDSTPDRPHRASRVLTIPDPVEVVDVLAFTRVLSQLPQPEEQCARPNTISHTSATPNVLKRATAYLSTLPSSVEGNSGSQQMLHAARILVHDFALSPADSLPLLREYNQRAEPPWPDSELKRKLSDADSWSRQSPQNTDRGRLLASEDGRHSRTEDCQSEYPLLPGPVYPVPVSDFVPATRGIGQYWLDQEGALESGPGRPTVNQLLWLKALMMHAIWQGGRTPVLIPDEVVAAGLYGAAPPSRWQERFRPIGQRCHTVRCAKRAIRRIDRDLRTVVENLEPELEANGESPRALEFAEQIECLLEEKKRIEKRASPEGCEPQCPWHGSSHAHDHFVFAGDPTGPEELREVFGSIANFAIPTEAGLIFNFDIVDADGKKRLEKHIKSQELHWTYMPVLLFGQAAGMSLREIRLIQGLFRELTRRSRQRNAKQYRKGLDAAEVVENGRVPGQRGKGTVTCPQLDANERYVTFGGNLRDNQGRGYRLIGTLDTDWKSLGGWLRRFGYPALPETPDEQIRKWILCLLNDLDGLSNNFSLTVVGYGQDGTWYNLDELIELAKSSRRDWLRTTSMRVYAPHDYLARWRHWFAGQLGYSYIPGGTWSEPATVGATDHGASEDQSPLRVRTLLKRAGVTQNDVARALGWNKSTVSRQIRGVSPLSDELLCMVRSMTGQSRK